MAKIYQLRYKIQQNSCVKIKNRLWQLGKRTEMIVCGKLRSRKQRCYCPKRTVAKIATHLVSKDNNNFLNVKRSCNIRDLSLLKVVSFIFSLLATQLISKACAPSCNSLTRTYVFQHWSGLVNFLGRENGILAMDCVVILTKVMCSILNKRWSQLWQLWSEA